jgi:CheY-like chemotaxis protein
MGVKDAVAVELDSRPRKTLLVIDDVAENRAMLVDLLAPLGFELSEAASGSEALELLP